MELELLLMPFVPDTFSPDNPRTLTLALAQRARAKSTTHHTKMDRLLEGLRGFRVLRVQGSVHGKGFSWSEINWLRIYFCTVQRRRGDQVQGDDFGELPYHFLLVHIAISFLLALAQL
jgi:hypothetical protein